MRASWGRAGSRRHRGGSAEAGQGPREQGRPGQARPGLRLGPPLGRGSWRALSSGSGTPGLHIRLPFSHRLCCGLETEKPERGETQGCQGRERGKEVSHISLPGGKKPPAPPAAPPTASPSPLRAPTASAASTMHRPPHTDRVAGAQCEVLGPGPSTVKNSQPASHSAEGRRGPQGTSKIRPREDLSACLRQPMVLG